MSIVVNTNIGSLNAQRSLAESSRELSTAMERLSSGKKINSAADDAAGFAIAERMTAQIRGLNMATKNANDGLAMLATIENATNDVTDMLQRVRELAVQASNDTNSTTDREYLQKEVDSLLNEINRVASQTVYNDQVVLDGTHTGQLQVGTDNGQNIAFAIKSIDTDTLGLTGSAAVTGVTGVASVDTAATTALLTAVNGATAASDTVAFSAFGSTLTFNVEAASANTAGSISQEGGSGAADVDTLLADIQAHTDYGSANFTASKSGTDLVFTAKTTGANAARASYTVTGGSAVEFNQTTAGVTAVTAVTAAAAGATSGAFTAGSTPIVIATTSNDNSVDSSGSAQTPSATGDNVLGLSVLTASDAEAALTKITTAIEQVAGNRAEYGAMANRLEYTVSNLMNVAEFTTAARSRIEDADFAAESARLAKAQVLQQTGTAMLAQANASSQLAIQLIR
jgi:flagellin